MFFLNSQKAQKRQGLGALPFLFYLPHKITEPCLRNIHAIRAGSTYQHPCHQDRAYKASHPNSLCNLISLAADESHDGQINNGAISEHERSDGLAGHHGGIIYDVRDTAQRPNACHRDGRGVFIRQLSHILSFNQIVKEFGQIVIAARISAVRKTAT